MQCGPGKASTQAPTGAKAPSSAEPSARQPIPTFSRRESTAGKAGARRDSVSTQKEGSTPRAASAAAAGGSATPAPAAGDPPGAQGVSRLESAQGSGKKSVFDRLGQTASGSVVSLILGHGLTPCKSACARVHATHPTSH